MGSEKGQDNERPIHRVWLDEFSLAECQVTHAEYAQFLAATGHAQPAHWNDPNFVSPEQPVVAVSWFDAVAYCEWLAGFRLPTEAEWEFAARGGFEQQLYPWGNAPVFERPGYATRWAQAPEPAGTAPPNGFGLYDMCENVHEWCADWYDPGYYAVSPADNPPGPPSGNRRASRGGAWRHHIKIARCAARSSIPPEFCYADYGFRVAANSRR